MDYPAQTPAIHVGLVVSVNLFLVEYDALHKFERVRGCRTVKSLRPMNPAGAPTLFHLESTPRFKRLRMWVTAIPATANP